MQELQQRILQDGDILPGGVVRVERFLNHRVDTALARHIWAGVRGRFPQ